MEISVVSDIPPATDSRHCGQMMRIQLSVHRGVGVDQDMDWVETWFVYTSRELKKSIDSGGKKRL